jgi:uncharacterized protein (TIGR03437 family)
MPVSAAVPGIFVTFRDGGRNQGAILNENSSVNGPANAAARDSVIQIFGTGIVPEQGAVTVRIGGLPAEILFAGQAQDLIAGVIQVNARIPEGLPAGDAAVVLSQDDSSSPPGVVVALR